MNMSHIYAALGAAIDVPDITPATMIFIGVLILLFAFFVFLFFSWHTAVFYIGDKEYSRVAAPFMKDLPLPIPELEEGMRFVGWYKDSELLEEYEKESYTMKLFDVTFYAKIEPLPEEGKENGYA